MVTKYFEKGLTIAVSLVTLVTFWWMIETRIIGEIHDHTAAIAAMQAQDVRNNIIILDEQMRVLQAANEQIPSYISLHKRLLEEQLKDLKEWRFGREKE